MRVEEQSENRLARKVRLGRLLDIYGPLLTERQREFVRLHHNEDLSLGEIAREFHVSRQAVHDAVRQAEATMEHYEENLGLLGRPIGSASRAAEPRSEGPEAGAAEAGAAAPPYEEFREVVAELEAMRRHLATQGIIYDPGSYVRALDKIIAHLRRLLDFDQATL